jgi:hypothetical protein
MLDRTTVLWTIAACMSATAVAAQAPAPTGTAIEWPEVDCRAAKLTTTVSQPRCQRGPLFNPGGKQYTGYDCADEAWNVTARSPTNFGFALLYNIRTLVPGCAVSYPGGIAKALKGYPPFPQMVPDGRR